VWHTLFDLHVPVAEKLIRTVLVYALIAVLVRVLGKRGMSGLNTLDIAVVFLLSNVVQNAIIGDDLTITGGAVGAVTLVVVDTLLNQAAIRSSFVAKIFDGTETPVIVNGTVLPRAMKRLGLRRADLEHAVRLQNGSGLDQVQSGVLMPGGQLLLTLRPEEQSASRGDVDRLTAQLNRIEQALAERR
jgi:uncharacterized membrane protein YcaP (DUF421 family)